MCYHFQSGDMLEWLKTQVRVIEAWREDVASRPDLDLDLITRIEQHYQWLTAEVVNLERSVTRRATSPVFGKLRAV
ncbi:MAG: hypothetical protein NXH88_13475 [Hyphomonas sp.]|nr:hypothetical protein [Hyphomonas sp.]